MRGLAEKVVVVAGGGSGIGAATARRLGAEGSRVVVGDLDPKNAQAVADEIEAVGGVARAHEFDIGRRQIPPNGASDDDRGRPPHARADL